jgi:peptidoglycan/xylan/chitin deacetylase (PgdA/CDA1 family)
MTERVLAILGFHKVGEPCPGGWETWYYNSEAEFADYLRYLRNSRWQVIDVATLLRGLTEPDVLPSRAALLTFDDGYRSTWTVALPLLLRFSFPAVVFALAGCVGHSSSRFDADSREPDEPLCDWEDLRALERHGVSVQSHGVTHRAFSALGPVEQEEELRHSKAVLEDRLQKPVELYCFPYGDGGPDPAAVGGALVRAGYKAACLYDGRVNPVPFTDPFRLGRLAVGRGTGLAGELGSPVRPG